MRFVLAAWLLLLTFSGSTLAEPQKPVSTAEQFRDEFKSVPCINSEREAAVRALFRKMGASRAAIIPQTYLKAENLLVRKPGTEEGLIIVGAHYDKVPLGCGAFDNWTGVVTVAHLYRSLKSTLLKKTILFVAFGNEEQGAFGSRGMANALEAAGLANYCAMINIDSRGLIGPQVMDNTSSESLRALAEEVANNLKIPFAHARIEGGDADSSSFLRKQIPSVTIHGMTEDWPTILHSPNDRAAAVKPESVYLGYRLALALVTRLDNMPCDASRSPGRDLRSPADAH